VARTRGAAQTPRLRGEIEGDFNFGRYGTINIGSRDEPTGHEHTSDDDPFGGTDDPFGGTSDSDGTGDSSSDDLFGDP
jgi:hypothetical protein